MNNKTSPNDTPIKWTWYLFLFTNIVLLTGIGISWVIIANNGAVQSHWYVSIVVCDIISMGLAMIFYYFETKELFYLKMHVPHQCFYYYLSSGIIFLIALLFTMVMTPSITKISPGYTNITLPFALLFGITGFLTLISIGLYRYGKFKIEVAIYKRRHGEMINKQEETLKEKDELQKLSDDEIKNKRQEHESYSSVSTPTSNLISNVDKEQKN